MQSAGGSGTKEQGSNRGSSTNGRPSKISPMNVVTIAVALVALVAAVLVPGPAGPGSRASHGSRGGPMAIGSSCTHYTGAEVTIAVPGAGSVAVSATVGVGINHTSGVSDTARLVLAATATDCLIDNSTAFVSVPFSLPTDPFHYVTVPLLRSFAVPGAATVTFYVNALMDAGGGPGDRFDSASLEAVFYPA